MPSNPILICAPSTELRMQLESHLGDLGYATTSVRTPADAVSALRDRPFDLIVAEGLAVSGAIGGMRAASQTHAPMVIVAPAADVEARIAFLEAGDKAKVTLRFRGREMAHQEFGVRLLERVRADLQQVGIVEQFPKLEGRQMVMVLAPKKKGVPPKAKPKAKKEAAAVKRAA